MLCFDRTVPSLLFVEREVGGGGADEGGGERHHQRSILLASPDKRAPLASLRPLVSPSVRSNFEELLLSEPFNFLEGRQRP